MLLLLRMGDDEIEKFAVGVGPERAPFSVEEVSRRGWEKISKALYKALSACCPIGSASSAYVQQFSDGRNGCAAWQKLRFTYRPRRAGNGVVDKNNLLDLQGSSVLTGVEQLTTAAGVSFGSSRCA